MSTLNDHVREYANALSKGSIQKAYKGIMALMTDLKIYLEGKHGDFYTSALYFGYMDMTYFAFTPPVLKDRKLKIAVVYLHEQCKFEVWLAANNRTIQAEFIKLLSNKYLGTFSLSQPAAGVDSIIAATISEAPDFNNPDKLKSDIENATLEFIEQMIAILE